MDLDTALDFASNHRTCVLITLRRDGRAQSSDVAYDVGDDGIIRISVTGDRAKTTNMRRDDRVVLHVTSPGTWSYASFDGTVELTPEAAEPGDAVCQELSQVFEAISGEPHPDWDEFHRAMVAERRLVVRFTPASVAGQVNR